MCTKIHVHILPHRGSVRAMKSMGQQLQFTRLAAAPCWLQPRSDEIDNKYENMTILDILKNLASPAQHSHHPMIPKMSFPAFRDNYSPFNSMYTIKLRFHSFQKIISRIYKPIAKNNFKYLKISHSLFCIYLYSIDTPHSAL